ncbi:MAG: phosphatidylglycerophosphatase A [Deltaproteobacteria bacterium]|nr:phosphatidylglycerophosphatase A [Deltaproteobacteria bacterium]
MKKFILFFASGAGVGFLPGPTGTYGTAVGVGLYALLKDLPEFNYLFFVLAFFLFSVWISAFAENIFQEKDSGKIVIDEIIGYFVTMLFLPFSLKLAMTGFVVFRLFDILKPFPIRSIDRHLKNGWGVVLDDVVAGIFSNIVLQVLVHWIHF